MYEKSATTLKTFKFTSIHKLKKRGTVSKVVMNF